MMEPKSKLMGTASCGEGRGGCVENGSMKDRLSSLPDEVAHHILSLSTQPHSLKMKDSALFSCVSKRCRELVLSNPTLRIYDPFASTSTCIERLEFMNSLDRLLAHRGDNKLQLFDIVWYPHYSTGTPCFCKNEKFRIITWIHNVLRGCKVETLYLFIENSYLDDNALPAFPSYIFHSESLTSLMVDFHCTIQAPSLAFSSNLKSLELRYVTIVDEGFFKWISCCCKFIEDIYLDNVYGPKNVTIQSSSLESFRFECLVSRVICHLHISGEKLKEIVIDWRFDSPMNKSLNIFAPNLKKFNWVGNLMNHPNLGKLVCLEEAEIRLQPRVDDWNNVFEVLCSLRGAKAVILTEEVIKTSGFNMGYWKLQDLAFFDQLKEFTMELWEGSNGIELARYVLENAQNLEKMVIVHLPQHSDVERELSKSKIISNATLVFKSVLLIHKMWHFFRMRVYMLCSYSMNIPVKAKVISNATLVLTIMLLSMNF